MEFWVVLVLRFVGPDLGTNVAALRCSVLMLLPIPLVFVGMVDRALPDGLKTGAEIEAVIREGEVIGDELEKADDVLAATAAALGRVGLGWKAGVDVEPKADEASGPRCLILRRPSLFAPALTFLKGWWFHSMLQKTFLVVRLGLIHANIRTVETSSSY
jgi:hypothetical protein